MRKLKLRKVKKPSQSNTASRDSGPGLSASKALCSFHTPPYLLPATLTMIFVIITVNALWKDSLISFLALFLCHCSYYFHRLICGVSQPDEVLECIERGVDLFESFFPYLATERGCALTFSFDYQPIPEETCRSFEVNLSVTLKFSLFPINFCLELQARNMCIL